MSIATEELRTPPVGSFLAMYQSPPTGFDEYAMPSGEPRAAWRKFTESLRGVATEEFARRWEQARRMLRDNGVSYHVFGEASNRDRPWELDPFPLMLPAGEWERLAAALTQRAKLLNLVLADLYGPQRLIIEGILPPEFALANPLYMRAVHGLPVLNQRYVQFYAAHLARDEQGTWTVLADRTQAPAGAGYAVENRIVLSRMLPETYQACEVQRLAGFFLAVRETLQNLAPRHRENPRIVLLSPGPRSPAYFEDAYLARYLGYTLVEGGDLTVRDNLVYLKTLGGLIPVDVIMRRLADEDCDPLELHGETSSGVPGLTHAARCGNVAIANPLGSNLVEAPAFLAYLPALARRLLDEDLQLNTIPTWWCGQPEGLRYVCDHMDELVIRPAFEPRAKPILVNTLSDAQRAGLREKIRARPLHYVGQAIVTRSSVPVWQNGAVEAWRMGLRSFLVASGDSYHVMPGGLVRVSHADQPLAESTLAGEGSKDVWVLAAGPVKPVSLLHPAGEPLLLRRSGNDLPSRVADNMYWLGRNVERAEGAIRLMRSAIARLLGETTPGGQPELPVLLKALRGAGQGRIRPEAAQRDADDQTALLMERELLELVFDDQQPTGLRHKLNLVQQLTNIVRDRISIDSWRILNRLNQDWLPDYPLGVVPLGDVLGMLDQMVITLSAFSGLGVESMTRGPAWRFLDIGRRMERALSMASLLGFTLVHINAQENTILEALLEVADSSMTYRNRYLNILQARAVLDLLLSDETNPRSLAFQLAALATHVEHLPREASDALLSPEQRTVMTALAGVRLAEIDALVEADREQQRRHLDRVLTKTALLLRNLSDGLTHKYLVHAVASRQLAELRPGAKR